MLPRTIIHNSISLDGSLTGFEPNLALHYRLAGAYHPQAHLIGSNTVKIGAELFGGVPAEQPGDFHKPGRDPNLPYWVIPDTRGLLQGLLHTCRNFELCRDVIVLVSSRTPAAYLQHLAERNYTFQVMGTDHVDLRKALEWLSEAHQVSTVLADTGQLLGNLLFAQNLAAEISLLVHPVIVGTGRYPVFGEALPGRKLTWLGQEQCEEGCIWLRFQV